LRIVDMADVDPVLMEETTVEADRILAGDPELEQPERFTERVAAFLRE